jgi:hypothetical protein
MDEKKIGQKCNKKKWEHIKNLVNIGTCYFEFLEKEIVI